jgi:hypothetical protein
MFTYSRKAFATSAFHVVHKNADGELGSTVAGSNDEKTAEQDALGRNQRAKEFELDCTYVVLPREKGQSIG